MAVAQPAAVAKDNHLVTVLSLSFVLGMAVAIGVYLAWSRGVLPTAFTSFSSAIALFFCPPFILSVAAGPAQENDLALVIVVGTIVFANGFLYAGVAAGGYHVVRLISRRQRRES